jgi:2-polyprenyl-3-methyl-5-hydroxy-6-metoxy-1,4-benzoquinol methylase
MTYSYSPSQLIQKLYQNRFDKRNRKNAIWKILCKKFFQKFIDKNFIVCDIAAGNCEFINNIECKQKIAFDLNPDLPLYADANVETVQDSFFNMNKYLTNKIDIIFISNVLEHLDTKEMVIEAIRLCRENLSENGKLIILQPNIKLTGGAYWDFIDHKLALTDLSLEEAAKICDLKLNYKIVRFLPYTTKSKMPQHPVLVWFYLKIPLAWRFLGQQSFLVFEK